LREPGRWQIVDQRPSADPGGMEILIHAQVPDGVKRLVAPTVSKLVMLSFGPALPEGIAIAASLTISA